MATTTTKKLYIEYKTDAGGKWTISLPDPKAGLDWATVEPVAQMPITQNLIRVGTAALTTITDAYIRQITDDDLNG